MELYIHFGLYKAGSSYIQYVCVNKKKILQKNGIFFPDSSEDEEMLNGKISKGNGYELVLAINALNQKKVSYLLNHWSDEAKKRRCEKVLISAEALTHCLADKVRHELLIDEAEKLGYNRIQAVGFIRDFAEHAVSTYKHRGKNGKIDDPDKWVREVYEMPKVLDSLVNLEKDSKIRFSLFPFIKNSKILFYNFFRDWLEVENIEFSDELTVNESVTISEVLLLNKIHKSLPYEAQYLKKILFNMKSSEKLIDRNNEDIIKQLFSNRLLKWNPLINKINNYYFLDLNKKLKPVVLDKCRDNDRLSISLSEKQGDAIANWIKYITTIRFIIRKGLVLLFKDN